MAPHEWTKSAKSIYYKLQKACTEIWENEDVQKYLRGFYKHLKKAMPVMMGYRYQTQVINQLRNLDGGKISNYSDANNCVSMVAVPIMDFTKLFDTFETTM